MSQLDLQRGGTTLVDDVDAELLAGRRLYLGQNGYVYLSARVDGRRQSQTLHAFLLGGATPGFHIDHINGDKLDNRRENLRTVTPQRNQVNRRRSNRNNTSGVRGVTHAPGTSRSHPWRAQISVHGRGISIGYYATKEEATAARRAAELEHFGELCP